MATVATSVKEVPNRAERPPNPSLSVIEQLRLLDQTATIADADVGSAAIAGWVVRPRVTSGSARDDLALRFIVDRGKESPVIPQAFAFDVAFHPSQLQLRVGTIRDAGKWTFAFRLRPEEGNVHYARLIVLTTRGKMAFGEQNDGVGELHFTFADDGGEAGRGVRVLSATVLDVTGKRYALAVSPPRVEIGARAAVHAGLAEVYADHDGPGAWFSYQLDRPSRVNLEIRDMAGELVRQVQTQVQSAGRYTFPPRALFWDGTGERGQRVRSGLFLYVFRIGNRVQTGWLDFTRPEKRELARDNNLDSWAARNLSADIQRSKARP